MGINFAGLPARPRGPLAAELDRVKAAGVVEGEDGWVCIAQGRSRSTATRINKGLVGGYQPGEFEAATRNGSGSNGDIYVRYIGEGGEDA